MAAINVSQTKNIQNAINNIKEHFKLFKSKDNTSSEGYYEVGSVKTVAATVLSRNKTLQHFVT